MTEQVTRRVFLGTAAAGALSSVALPAAALAPCEVPTKWNKTVDLLIIGAGGAGMAAAVAAAQNGIKNILILEKMPVAGGNTRISGGAFNSNNPSRQKAQNIEDSSDLHAKQTFEGGDSRARFELIKTMTDNSYDTIVWLESMGMKFQDKVTQIYGGLYPRAHNPFGSLGKDYIDVLGSACTKHGINIQTEARVVRVIREKQLDGAVVGVEIINKRDQHQFIKAKNVIAAAGGFGANPIMRALHDPRMLKLTTTNHPGATGDLIPLLQDIGAEVTGMDFIQCNPGCPPGRQQRIVLHLHTANFIMVGPDAKRFIREDERRDNIRDAVLSLPNQTGFSIVDTRGFEALNIGNQKMAEIGLTTGDSWKADTIEELATKMKVDPKALRTTIDEFNAGVDAKNDKLGKLPRNLTKIEKAPFWAGFSGMSVHHTMGGIVINKDTQVIDRNGKVIPNLYAVGELTGGIHGTNRLGGNAICDALTYGRLSGLRVAKIA